MTPARAKRASASPYPAQPTPTTAWAKNTRKRLHYIRADDPNWPEDRNQPLPHPSWMVDDPDAGLGPTRDKDGRLVMPGPIRDAMSDVQRRIYRYLQAVGKGKHNRPAIGERSRVWGTEGERPFDYTASVSIGNIGAALNLPAVTVRDNLARMTGKHYIFPMSVRTRGERLKSNREATVWRIPPYADALRAIREDPNIATTHGGADGDGFITWDNGRSNSRKFLTPAQAELWSLATRIPPRPQYKAPEATPPAAELTNAKVSVDPPKTAPELVSQPRPQKPQLPQVPPSIEAHIAELCGRIEGAPFTTQAKAFEPIPTDLCPEMLAGAQALAAGKEKTFPVDALGDLCERIFTKARKVERAAIVDEAGKQLRVEKVAMWKVDMPAAYLRHVCTTDSHTVELVLDTRERHAIRARADARQKIDAMIDHARQHPGHQAGWQRLLDASREYPELYAEVLEANDRKHGGDGTGTSLKGAGTRCTPDEHAKQWKENLIAGLVNGETVDEP